jgi:putative peptidoglycan lipid II flippase
MSTDNSDSLPPYRFIAQSAGIIGLATLCSRVLGFLRDVVIARVFGVYLYAQAFVVALRIPNLLRDLLGEGAANAAFVPVFSEYTVKQRKEEFWELANVVLNLLLVTLALLTILGIIFSPLLVRLIAPGFTAAPEKLATAIRLNRLIFPYILLVSLAAYATALLNSLKHFTIPAFAPCLLNISLILFTLLFGEGIKGLAFGVLLGGILQLAVQVPVLLKKGFPLKLFQRFQHPAAKTIGKLMLPRLFSSSIYQLNNFVDTIFGSLAVLVGEGGVAILYFAYRLIQFPLGIFSTALSQALLPVLSTQSAEERYTDLKKTFSFGLRATFFVMLPVSATFIFLSRPIVETLFGGGKFDLYSINATATVLLFYSLGLFSYAGNKIMQSCFFALKDTLTPAKISALALLINIVLNSLLIFPLKLAGIALATSISGAISFLLLLFQLRKKLKGLDCTALVFSFLRIFWASVLMAGTYFFVFRLIFIPGKVIPFRLFKLGISLVAGVIAYAFFCLLFRVGEIREFSRWLCRKQ